MLRDGSRDHGHDGDDTDRGQDVLGLLLGGVDRRRRVGGVVVLLERDAEARRGRLGVVGDGGGGLVSHGRTFR